VRVASAVVQTLASQIVQSAASLVTAILIARGLGPVGQGGYAVFVTAVGLGAVIASFGQYEGNVLTSAGTREPGRVLLSRAVVHALVVAAVLTALRPAWEPPATRLGVEGEALGLFPIIVALEIAALLLRGVNLGQHRVAAFNAVSLLQRLVYLLAIIGVARVVDLSLALVLRCWAVATAASLTVGAGWAWARSPGGAATLAAIRAGWIASLRRGWRPLVTIVLTLVLVRFDVWTLGPRLGSAAVGQISVASGWVEWLWYVPTVVSTVLFAAVAADPVTRRLETVAQAARLVSAVMVPAGIALMLVGDLLIPALYGDAYQEAGAAFVRLVPGAAAVAVHLVIDSHFAGRGFPPVSVLGAAGALALKAGLNAVLVPGDGIRGAAVATSVAFAALLTTKLLVLRAETRWPVHRFLLLQGADVREAWTRVRGLASSRALV